MVFKVDPSVVRDVSCTVFISGIFCRVIPPTGRIKLTIPPNGCQIVLKKNFGRDNELQIYHGNFLLTYIKHIKLFVIKQSKGYKFMPKTHQNTFGGRAPP